MIYDIDNNPIVNHLINLDHSASYVFTIRCDCYLNATLRSEAVSNILVEGRLEGDSTWINLETTPIPLDAFDGTRQNFEIRLTTEAVDCIRTFKLEAN